MRTQFDTFSDLAITLNSTLNQLELSVFMKFLSNIILKQEFYLTLNKSKEAIANDLMLDLSLVSEAIQKLVDENIFYYEIKPKETNSFIQKIKAKISNYFNIDLDDLNEERSLSVNPDILNWFQLHKDYVQEFVENI